ncbi:MAG: VCBS repeat-containing protein, partial [Planctomycetota bacterium]
MCLRILLSGFLFVSVLASSYALQSPLELDDLVSMSGLPQGISFIRPLDVDEDGDADIVLIGEYSNDVFWYENDGLGQFGPLTTLVTLLPGVAESAECSDVVLFDHGANGTRDLVVSENLTGRVVRFPRTGPAAFGPPVPVIQSSGRLGQLKALDVDGDGDEDLVIAGDLGSPGTWVMATANGGFLPPMRIGGGGRLVEPFDFEGDGDVDFFVSGFTIASLFLRNDGVGAGFTSRPLASTFTDADIAAGDVNGDGFADAIISRRSQTVAEIHLANAAGEFALTQGILGFHTFSPSVDLLDVDGDLDLDIVLPGPQNLNPVVLWAENLGGSFDSTASTLIPSEGNSEFLAVADFNGDSLPDFVGGGPPSRVQIALSDASGALSTMAPISDGWENLSGAVVLDADG